MQTPAPGRAADQNGEPTLKEKIKNWLLMALVIFSVLFLFVMVVYDATSMYCGFGDWLLQQCPQRIRPSE
jgi:hypothetical protein